MQLKNEYLDLTDESAQNIQQLIVQTQQRIQEQKNFFEKNVDAMKQSNATMHDELAKLPLSDAQISAEAARVRTETKVGLKAFNYLGIIFIFLAVVTLASLTMTYLTNTVKAVLIFMIPFVLLFFGELMHRRQKKIFAYGIIGGSIGLAYIAVFINFFILQVLSISLAFGLLLLVSAISMFLATRYKHFSIALLTLIGGYIPVISFWYIIGFTSNSLYFAQAYVLGLNIFILYLYRMNNWRSLYFTSMYFMIPWLFFLQVLKLHPVWIDYVYATLFLVLFAIMPLIDLYRGKVTAHLAIVYHAFLAMSVYALYGLTVIAFADISKVSMAIILASHLCMYGIAAWKFTTTPIQHIVQEHQKSIFYFSFIFAVLYLLGIALYFIPFTLFDNYRIVFVTMPLLVGLYVATTLQTKQGIMKITAVVHIFLYMLLIMGANLFIHKFKFTFNTIYIVTLLLSTYIYIRKQAVIGFRSKAFNIVLLVLVYCSAYWYLSNALTEVFTQMPQLVTDQKLWIRLIFSVCFVFIAEKIQAVRKNYLPLITSIWLGFGLLWLNSERLIDPNTWTIALVIIGNVAFMLTMLQMLKRAMQDAKITLSVSTIIFTILVLLNSTIVAYTNIDYSYLNIIIDIVYGFVAVFYIYFGFKRKLPIIRHIGLGGMLAVMAKFLFFDIPVVTAFSRMITFFVFGILSLGISYIYQTTVQKSTEQLEGKIDNQNE